MICLFTIDGRIEATHLNIRFNHLSFYTLLCGDWWSIKKDNISVWMFFYVFTFLDESTLDI